MNQRLGACVAMVAALHGAVLAWASQPAAGVAQAQGLAGPTVQVRVVASAQAEPPLTSASLAPSGEALTSALSGEIGNQQKEGESAIDLDGYVPRRWLTVAPSATAPVVLPFPDAFNDNARYTAIMKLYIEADGQVGRVEFEGVRLPAVLERAARSTFENVRFTPGQVNGRIVKSLIKIEVDFDNLAASGPVQSG